MLQHKPVLKTPSKEDYLVSAAARLEGGKENGGASNGSAVAWHQTGAQQEQKLEFDIPEPPLEYCELPRGTTDPKRGILSSIFDKVRSKEDGKKTVDCLPFSKDEHRKSQPLLDNIIDCAGGFRSNKEGEAGLAKPYEPPALGKSCRITPVGGVELMAAAVPVTTMEPASVEVLSVIRYSKLGPGSRQGGPSSSLACSASGSDTPASCASSVVSGAPGRPTRSRSSSRPDPPEPDCGGPLGTAFLRRSSAPEIEHEATGEERREIFTRSLGRTRRAGEQQGGEPGPADTSTLQRARAHLKETLEEKMKQQEGGTGQHQSETRAVVHRADSGATTHTGKTLDSDTIKQYQNIKQNTTAVKRYSGVFDGKGGGKGERVTGGHREHAALYKQGSYDNLNRSETEKVVARERQDRHDGENEFPNHNNLKKIKGFQLYYCTIFCFPQIENLQSRSLLGRSRLDRPDDNQNIDCTIICTLSKDAS